MNKSSIALIIAMSISAVGCATSPGQLSQADLAESKKVFNRDEAKHGKAKPAIYWEDTGDSIMAARPTLKAKSADCVNAAGTHLIACTN